MTVHRLRPRPDQADRVRPALNGVPLADGAAQRVPASGWGTAGRETALFEQEFAAHVGAAHAVAVSSCTAALELAMRALRIPPGGTVLIPAVTFCGAAQAVLHARLRPVLVDVDPHTAMPRICGEPARITPRRPVGRGTLLGRAARRRAAWAGQYSEGR